MNQKLSLLLSCAIAALLVFAPHKASAACASLPNVFVNGVSTVDASTTNANNNFLVACAKNVDNTQIGAAGIYASQIIPTNGTQATFGGAQTYTFPAAVTTGGALTVPSGGAAITGTVAVTGAITATTSISAGNATAAALTAGDVGASRSASTGAVLIGGSSSAATLDYGVTTGSALTNNTVFNNTNSISAGSATGAALSAGDVGASRSTTTGAVKLGGSGSVATLDYGVTTASTLTASVRLNDTGAISAGSATQATLTAGDLGASRSTTTGALLLGGSSSSAQIDWGITNASRLTMNQQTLIAANLTVTPGAVIVAGSGVAGPGGLVSGDISSSISATAGRVTLGGVTSSGTLDYGNSVAGQFTLSAPLHINGTGALISAGTGAPAFTAASGSIFLRTDGTAGNRIYVNQNGSTTWTAIAGV